jgi:hypothetical protein
VLARDGRFRDLHLVQSIDFVTDGEFLRSLEAWRCKPLVCNGVPVDSETFQRMELRGRTSGDAFER